MLTNLDMERKNPYEELVPVDSLMCSTSRYDSDEKVSLRMRNDNGDLGSCLNQYTEAFLP